MIQLTDNFLKENCLNLELPGDALHVLIKNLKMHYKSIKNHKFPWQDKD